MKRYWVPVFCGGLLLATGSLNSAAAQGSKTAAQVHIDKAKAAAYRPDGDLTRLYETVCAPAISEKGPRRADPTEGGQTAPSLANRKVPPKSEWMAAPEKVFDNLSWLRRRREFTGAATI